MVSVSISLLTSFTVPCCPFSHQAYKHSGFPTYLLHDHSRYGTPQVLTFTSLISQSQYARQRNLLFRTLIINSTSPILHHQFYITNSTSPIPHQQFHINNHARHAPSAGNDYLGLSSILGCGGPALPPVWPEFWQSS
jgi:hypothetical protein